MSKHLTRHVLDLIRHGKQHHERSQQPDVRQQREKELRAQDQALQPLPQNKSFPKDPVPSPNYRREAEMIVQEENEAKSKLPKYKGLEGYKLVEKMGEYVTFRLPRIYLLTSSEQWRFLQCLQGG